MLKMNRKHVHLLIACTAVVAVFGFVFSWSKAHLELPWDQEAGVDQVLEDVYAKREALLSTEDGDALEQDGIINILVLGLDSRKGNVEPHCDAIHMFHVDTSDWSIAVTSVPRGTYAYIPPGTYPQGEYYLANACSYAGLEYGIEQIERLIGVEADYYMTAGFSQVQGIVRLFGLPPTETLQFLRHRQSYAIGDPQRSHNQALFMKDMIVNHLHRFRSDFSSAFFFALYQMVDTDMSYATANTLLQEFIDAEIDQRPDEIMLQMKPYYATVDYHFDPETSPEDLQRRLEYLGYYLSDEDLAFQTEEEVQQELMAYLEARLDSEDAIDDVLQQQLWLQINDDYQREEYHYRVVEAYAYQQYQTQFDEVLNLITGYIIEKEAFDLGEYAERARGLLRYLEQ